MDIIKNWDNLTPAERDKLIETEIMGRPGAYTTSLAAAFELFDEMVRSGYVVSIFQEPDSPDKHCSVWNHSITAQIVKADCGTVPEAISKAALIYTYRYKK